MKIAIKQLEITNFKGIKNLCVNFSENTSIYGSNGSGKTTLFDAFTWCLFGKDSHDNSDTKFNLKTIENGEVIPEIDHSVELTIYVDGQFHMIKRTLREDWVKPTGQIDRVFKGNSTTYMWNDVPLKASEFSKKVSELINETVFKMVTNPNYFSSLHWEKQREALMMLVPDLSDEEIKITNPELKDFIESIEGKNLIEIRKEIAFKKKKLAEELSVIPGKIEQTRKLMPELFDFTQLKSRRDELMSELKELEILQGNELEKEKLNIAKAIEIEKKISALKLKQFEILSNEEIKNREAAHKANEKIIDLERGIDSTRRELLRVDSEKNEIISEIARIDKLILQKEEKIVSLRAEWNKENSKTYTLSSCLMCPVFGHECKDSSAIAKHAENSSAASEAFNFDKANAKKAISEQGTTIKAEIEALKIQEEKLNNDLKNKMSELSKIETGYNTAKELLSTFTKEDPKSVVKESIKEWADAQKEIESLSVESVQSDDATVIVMKKNLALSELGEINEKLMAEKDRERFEKEIDSLNKDKKELAQQIASLEKTEYLADTLNKVKMDYLERKINEKFKIVKFSLFEKNNDGYEYPWCKATLDGVSYMDVNNAGKINMGIDIINVLSDFYDVYAPIWIDNCESISNPLETKSQMIKLYVSEEDKTLKFK